MTKTNAMRLLDIADIAYSTHEYDTVDGQIDGVHVAEKLGIDPMRVYKTLITVGKGTGHFVFVIPVSCELDLRKAAAAAGEKYVEMIRLKELEPLTGYVHGGCSPIGMKRALPTFIEETAELFQTIVVSAGRVGFQVELSPLDLAQAIDARFADLV